MINLTLFLRWLKGRSCGNRFMGELATCRLHAYFCFTRGRHQPLDQGVEGAGLTVGGRSPDAPFGFYKREAFQSQTNTEKILYNKSG